METLQRMKELAKTALSKRKRQDGTPDFFHAWRVTQILTEALQSSGECTDEEELLSLRCGALGHDLLEDTDTTEEEIIDVAGNKTLQYIKYLTNAFGDDKTAPYVAQIEKAPEEAKLLKLADLTDNLLHGSFSVRVLGLPWMHSFFLPIVDPMLKMLQNAGFERYPKTAEFLLRSATLARAHLAESMRAAETETAP